MGEGVISTVIWVSCVGGKSVVAKLQYFLSTYVSIHLFPYAFLNIITQNLTCSY